ncbi:pseudouridine-5'-phosphate glycosidase [Tribonema minus]|uniref:Pseudouridine-5'-phosphate glycosidase n=1 Tax=Tribonema minus TaxID=303371 RepID=A0A835YQE2_9STRA|nr:pseudouridine-5'-phosphate glycosidase [Tribonema minus]
MGAGAATRAWPICVKEEVRQALAAGKPVVALESTIISHGMPWPANLQTGLEVEEIVREHGCTPATIAIMEGMPCVGLTQEQLEVLAKAGTSVRKCSRRDIALAMAQKAHGATTVAATMVLAHLAGIQVFATGGTGGVHRDVADTMDISADITELARTPVTVVSAGVKSILDVPRTLEALETAGVPVMTLGSDEFPAFFSPASGTRAPARVESAEEVAAAIHASNALGLTNGMLVAVPNLAPGGEEIEAAVQTALREAHEQGITGREVTPFLLSRIHALTGNASLRSNVALVKNNARERRRGPGPTAWRQQRWQC